MPNHPGALHKLGRLLPRRLIRKTVSALPTDIHERLLTHWFATKYNWDSTRYFPLPMDQAGYFRVNVKGREPRGIVEAGREYDATLDELEEALLSYQDIDTGERIVKSVFRREDLAPVDAPYKEVLPDLIVTWEELSAIRSKGICSKKYGDILGLMVANSHRVVLETTAEKVGL